MGNIYVYLNHRSVSGVKGHQARCLLRKVVVMVNDTVYCEQT
jgi:hypothetical protein